MRRLLPLLLLVVFLPTPAYANHVFVVYMSPSGSDANSGASGSPVKTLARVHDILEVANPGTDVEVRIEQGTYIAGETDWTWSNGHTVTFAPDDWEPGDGIDDIAGRPVFRGNNTPGWWMDARVGNLRFYYLQVEMYGAGGLLIHGGYTHTGGYVVPDLSGADGNTIVGMYFWKLGTVWAPADEYGYAAVDLVNSSDNLIRANHFRYLENTGTGGSHIHGVYVAHGSSRNEVVFNKFYKISGQPVRTRNMSNDNDFGNNTMELTSNTSHYGEWFCGESCHDADPEYNLRECASQGNYYHDNDQISHYYLTSQWTWTLVPSGLWEAGPGCAPLAAQRLRTSGNL
jgi:hypothetical protein